MRKFVSSLCLILSLALGSLGMGWSADFQKGMEAYNNGDFATALKEWKPLAEGGDTDAQYNLGIMYDEGQGVPQDYQESAKWYTIVAEKGYPEAQRQVALLHYYGNGVPQDYQEAIKILKQSSNQRD